MRGCRSLAQGLRHFKFEYHVHHEWLIVHYLIAQNSFGTQALKRLIYLSRPQSRQHHNETTRSSNTTQSASNTPQQLRLDPPQKYTATPAIRINRREAVKLQYKYRLY